MLFPRASIGSRSVGLYTGKPEEGEISSVADMAPSVPISRLKMAVNVLLLVVWILLGALTMLVAKLTRWRWLEYSFPLLFHGQVSRLFGLQPEIGGEPISTVPTLFVANHVSYMDVFVLGKLIKGAFVAKSEVAGWPVFGKLAALQNTLFLERRAARAAEQVGVVQQHLATRGNLIMFPEGTSTSGDYVARFRSSLFAATQGVMIQPVSVVYSHLDGAPMTAAERDNYAWYLIDPAGQPGVNNKPFATHFVEGLGLGGFGRGKARVQVIFHKPLRMEGELTRKDVAKACEEAIRHGLHKTLDLPYEDSEYATDT